MSIDAHGMSRLACVFKWSIGFCSSFRPLIHILAGLKVCIQQITPAQAGSTSAARSVAVTSACVLTVGFQTMSRAISPEPFSESTIRRECSATCFRVSSP